jgi:hypothetical protein
MRASALNSRAHPRTMAPYPPELSIMGKYVLGWFLGVPTIVLVILYLIFH